MKILELEKLINDKAIESGLTKIENQTYYDYVGEGVLRIVREILKNELAEDEFRGIYITTNKGNVIVKTYCDYKNITIKVKRLKGEKKFNYGFTQYYYLNRVEIDYTNKEDTLDDWYDYNKKLYEEKQQKDNNTVEEFMKFLKDKNISIEEFDKYAQIYRTHNWDIKRKLKE